MKRIGREVGIICAFCGAKVLKNLSDILRNEKLGRKKFCSIKCSSRYYHANKDIEKYKQTRRKPNQFSQFRRHLRQARARVSQKGRKYKEFAITLQDLKDQWDKQNGICPYTGWKLVNCEAGTPSYKKEKTPDRASLDRIDSSKGYIKGNIQFICLIAQYAKHTFSEEEFLNFCLAVAKYRPTNIPR